MGLFKFDTVTRPYATPTIATTAYANGQSVGQLLSFPIPGKPCFILSVTVVDKANAKGPLTLHFFNRKVADVADQQPWTLPDNDAMAQIATVTIAAADYVSHGTQCATRVYVPPAPIPAIHSASGAHNIWLKIVAGGAVTYSANNDLMVLLTLGA